jgi:hypothetical protein
VAAALGYIDGEVAIPALVRLLGTRDPLVVMRALDACLRIAKTQRAMLLPDRVPTLVDRVMQLMDPATDVGYGTDERAATLAAACFRSVPAVLAQLRRRRSGGYHDRLPAAALSPAQRDLVNALYGAAQAVLPVTDASLWQIIADALHHSSATVRSEARFLLRASPYASALAAAVITRIPRAPRNQQQAMVRMLGILGQRWVAPHLGGVVRSNGDMSVRLSAVGSMCDIPFTAAPPWCAEFLRTEPTPVIRLGLVHAAGTHGWAALVQQGLTDAAPGVRREARYWRDAPVAARHWPTQRRGSHDESATAPSAPFVSPPVTSG